MLLLTPTVSTLTLSFLQVLFGWKKQINPGEIKFECVECGKYPKVLIIDGTSMFIRPNYTYFPT